MPAVTDTRSHANHNRGYGTRTLDRYSVADIGVTYSNGRRTRVRTIRIIIMRARIILLLKRNVCKQQTQYKRTRFAFASTDSCNGHP